MNHEEAQRVLEEVQRRLGSPSWYHGAVVVPASRFFGVSMWIVVRVAPGYRPLAQTLLRRVWGYETRVVETASKTWMDDAPTT
jgi:hypothetical protein